MKKSSFVAMVMGTVGGILFAIGMCMCLLPEWEAFTPGVVMGGIGLTELLATVIVWRKMVGKKAISLTKKSVGNTLLGAAGTLLLGVGMCFVMVWSNMILGIIIGTVGIVALLSLIPMVKGFKNNDVMEVSYERH
jgi:hypothetical protein